MIFDMAQQIENILKKLIIIDDYSQFMKELIENQSIELDKIIRCVMDNIEHIQNQTKLEQLAQFIGHTCFEKQSLAIINYEINLLDNNQENFAKKIFLKKVLKEIGKE